MHKIECLRTNCVGKSSINVINFPTLNDKYIIFMNVTIRRKRKSLCYMTSITIILEQKQKSGEGQECIKPSRYIG